MPTLDPSRPRRPLAWGLLAALAVAAGLYAWRTFPSAFPLLDLDVRMSRQAALQAADSVATSLGLGPAGARQAAAFTGEGEVQTLVELEGSGPEGFRALVREGRFHAFQWEVRRFLPGTAHEVRLYFTPGGTPYGFAERLPEDAPGAALPADTARRLAEAAAARDWGVALEGWTALAPAAETRPSGRVDHTFSYERSDPALGAGRLRLRLEVAGDRLTAVRRLVEVPEAFTRRYREMRSANDGIATAATYAMLVLYGLGGIVLGLVVLARRQPLHLRQAGRWAAALAGLVTASAVNFLPLAWMDFDTALGTTTFLFQQVGLAVASLLGLTAMFGASFLGGENLARAGFGSHPFLWGAFGREAGATRSLRDRVLLGMLLTPVFLAYAVGFSSLSDRWSGWWSPLSPLTDPNLIAMPLPALAVISGPVQAAVWEELLFRAVPFGAALLLAGRFGGRRAWLAAAFLVQAIIFAAAHANYPAQPSYARLVELLLPSFLFGALFLRWGLVPAIVLHFEYDLVLFALPLLATPATALVGSKLLVAAAALVPLGILVVRRQATGAWGDLGAEHRNAAHRAGRPVLEEAAEPPLPARPVPVAGARLDPRALVLLLVAGAGAWGWGQVTRAPGAPQLALGRAEVEAAARAAFEGHGIEVEEGWTVVSRLAGGASDAHVFVWTTAGPAIHDSLLGRFLPAPRWVVALRRYEGDVAERAEEWLVEVGADGTAGAVEHRLPEGRPGPSLEEPAARALADSALQAALGLDPRTLFAIAAVPAERPARRDWRFTWADTLGPAIGQGQLRVEVSLAGDEVTRVNRMVHLPEEWQRERRGTVVQRLLPAFLAGICLAGLGVVAVVAGLAGWSRGSLSRRRTLRVGAVAAVAGLVSVWNGWESMLTTLSTSEPVAIQLPILVGWTLLFALLLAAATGLMTGLPLRPASPPGDSPWLPGMALGAAVVGVRALVGILARGESPSLPVPGALEAASPILADALSPVEGLLAATALLVGARWALARARQSTAVRQILAAMAMIGLAVVVGGAGGPESPGLQLVALGAGLAVTLWGMRQVVGPRPAAIPVAAGTVSLFGLAGELLSPDWPGGRLAAGLGIIALGVATAWLARELGQDKAPPPEGDGAAALPRAA